jgi:hypothetical protein
MFDREFILIFLLLRTTKQRTPEFVVIDSNQLSKFMTTNMPVARGILYTTLCKVSIISQQMHQIKLVGGVVLNIFFRTFTPVLGNAVKLIGGA